MSGNKLIAIFLACATDNTKATEIFVRENLNNDMQVFEVLVLDGCLSDGDDEARFESLDAALARAAKEVAFVLQGGF